MFVGSFDYVDKCYFSFCAKAYQSGICEAVLKEMYWNGTWDFGLLYAIVRYIKAGICDEIQWSFHSWDRDLVIQYGLSEYPVYPRPLYASFTVFQYV